MKRFCASIFVRMPMCVSGNPSSSVAPRCMFSSSSLLNATEPSSLSFVLPAPYEKNM